MEGTNQLTGRVRSIDALRGFDMFFIIGFSTLVVSLCKAFPGSVSDWFRTQTQHVEWNGLHIHDMIYPLFIFVTGLSFPFSYAKQVERGDSQKKIHLKLVKRLLLLIFMGWVFNGFFKLDFSDFRYASVLGRIGISWFCAALLYIHCPAKTRAYIAGGILLGYWLLISHVPAPDMPAGTDPLSLEGNFAGYIDRLIMPGHLWEKGIMEPSGTIENLPSIVTVLFGMFTGDFIRSRKDGLSGNKKTLILLAAAAVMLAVGLLISLDCPINKKIWSSSFTLVNGAASIALFALFYWIIDVKGHARWSFFFQVIGMNAITIYMAQKIIGFGSINNFFLGGLASKLGEPGGAILLAAGVIAVKWLFLYFLYKKKVFLKV